jgi:hypothetical protein
VSNEVVNYADAPIEVRKSYASTLSSAGDLLPRGLTGIINPGTPEQRQGIVPGRVLLVLETGAMLGINPMAALQGINIIEGSASISPALMQAVIRRAGHRMRVDVTGTVADGTIAATARLTRTDEPDQPYIVTWTPHDAVQADLATSYVPDADGVWHVTARSKDGNKLNWEKYTRQMLKWRAQSEVVRDGGMDAMMGVRYTPEELGGGFGEEGEPVSESVGDFSGRENGMIDQIRNADDRTQMSKLMGAAFDADLWTQKVQAEFAGKLADLPKEDTRAGSPGNTGIDVIDQRTGEVIEDADLVDDDAPPEPDPEPIDVAATTAAWGDVPAKAGGLDLSALNGLETGAQR